MTADLFQALVPVLQSLEKLNVVYFVGGSVASSAYGLPRTTIDVDLVAELKAKHVGGLVAALADTFYISESMIHDAIQRHSCFNLIHLETMYKVDIFVAKNRPFDQSASSRITREEIGEPGEALHVWLASAEDVILNKLEWYRLGDEVSERQWLDVLGVLKVQRDRLDLTYLRRWAAELNV
ncbi:MAG TPA: hypothetical protein VMX74_02945, partial [Pirellulales bacterium]|nr:hypothetical protein [Pirellulales bacterium]